MNPPYFDVTAECVRCGVFTLQRKKVNKINSEGKQYTINNLVCPKCRMWADITRIESVHHG